MAKTFIEITLRGFLKELKELNSKLTRFDSIVCNNIAGLDLYNRMVACELSKESRIFRAQYSISMTTAGFIVFMKSGVMLELAKEIFR